MARHDVESGKVKLKVTEHAIARYLQRVHGLDVEQILKEMLPEEILEIIDLCTGLPTNRPDSEGAYFSCASHTVVIQNGTVVTVLTPEMVKLPSDEWEDWATSATLRSVPVEGSIFQTLIECEVQRRVNDKGWQLRQENQVIKTAHQNTNRMRNQYQTRITKLEKEFFAAKNRAAQTDTEVIERLGLQKANSQRICDHVKELLGYEKYQELEKNALLEKAT